MKKIIITFPGEPRGKGRPRFHRHGVPYTPKATRIFENNLKIIAQQAMFQSGFSTMLGQIYVRMAFVFEPPQSWSKKRRAAAIEQRAYKDSKPDTDNIVKAFLDACEGIVFSGDKNVVHLEAEKHYGAEAMCVAEFEELERGA